jgi:L-alanine-DL-glutamate epimerase-like enolase superfamily enzyme
LISRSPRCAPWLECDITDNAFRDALLTKPLNIPAQIAAKGTVTVPAKPGIGGEPDRALLTRYAVT